jgi:hypothetical protein
MPQNNLRLTGSEASLLLQALEDAYGHHTMSVAKSDLIRDIKTKLQAVQSMSASNA